MKSNYKKLGSFIRQVDVRNRDLAVNRLLGVSITKKFIESKANTVGTDFHNYKVVHRGQFAYGPVTSRNGDKVSIALLVEDECIISSSYSVFEIIDQHQLIPEYLMLWFSRPEFERYARYKSHGSVREIFDWDQMCNVELPVPSYEEQLEIVNNYRTISERIELKKKINDNLESQTQLFFDFLFLNDAKPNCTLRDISEINPLRSLSKGENAKCYNMACLPTQGCIPEDGEIKPYNGGVRFKNGDTLIARITPCLENGKAAFINILDEGEIAFGSTEYIVFSSANGVPAPFYYFLIRSSKFMTFALQYMNGSSGRQRVSGEELGAFPLKKPSQDTLNRFDTVATPIMEQFRKSSIEIARLKQLQELLISSISSH